MIPDVAAKSKKKDLLISFYLFVILIFAETGVLTYTFH
jgi:hypothetical protein